MAAAAGYEFDSSNYKPLFSSCSKAVNSTAYARYVGRVGALAVALGVGVAVAAGGSGLAWADPGSTGDSQSAGAASVDGSETSSGQGAEDADSAAPSKESGSAGGGQAGGDGDDDDAPEADVPAMNLGGSGSVDTSVNDVGQSTDTTVPTEDEGYDESDLSDEPELDADDEDEGDGGESTSGTTEPAVSQRDSAPQSGTSDEVDRDSGRIDDVAPVVEDVVERGADEVTEQQESRASLTSQVMLAVENLVDERQVSTTAASHEPDPAPTPASMGIADTFVGVASNFVAAILSPFLTPSPVAPAEPPLAWALLAFARREWQHMLLNRTPQAVVDTITTSEDTPITVDVVTGTDPDAVAGDVVTVTDVTQPQNGTVTLQGGTLTYTPNPDFHGTDTFAYTITDEESPLHIHGLRGLWAAIFGGDAGHGDTVSVTVTVAPVNDAPVAVDDAVTVDEDSGATEIDVLGNDTDIDGDDLSVTAASAAGNGTVTLVDGVLTYTPDADFHGSDTFTYTVSDGNGGTSTATVTVTVTAVQDPPAPQDDTYTTEEDTPLTIAAPGVLGNDVDVDGDDLSVQLTLLPTFGTLALNADGSFTYTPDTDFHGTDSFTYTVSDGDGGTATATVHVTVNPVNDAPVANPDSVSTRENTPVAIDVLGNDTDVDGDALAVTDVGTAENGTVTLVDGVITYTPNADFLGADSFTYTISDGYDGVATATVHVTVNNPPVANDDEASTEVGIPVVIDVLANDGGVGQSVEIIHQPRHGTAEVNDDGTITYTPTGDIRGIDHIGYEISDGTGARAHAMVNIELRERTLLADDVAVDTDENRPTLIHIFVRDHLPGEDTDIAIRIDRPDNGVVRMINQTAWAFELEYTPPPDFVGTESFTYQLVGADGRVSYPYTVTITVNPVTGGPRAIDDTVIVDENSDAIVIDVLGNDFDVDDQELTVVQVSEARNGTLELTDGVITYRPNTGFDGIDSFTYTVANGLGSAATATVTVTVKDADPITFDDGALPSETIFPEYANRMYVLTGKELRIVDTVTRKWSGTVDLGATPSSVTMSPRGDYVYVGTSDGTDVTAVTKIDLRSGISTPIGAVGEATAMTLDRYGEKLYVADYQDASVSVFDTMTGKHEVIDIGLRSKAIAVSEYTETLYVGSINNEVWAVDVGTGSKERVYSGAWDETSVADPSITVAGGFAYVTDELNNAVAVIDTYSNETYAVYDIWASPTSVAASPFSEVFLVASAAENKVTVISLELGVLGAFEVGGDLIDIDFAGIQQPDVYVTKREGISRIPAENFNALFRYNPL